MSIPEKTNIFNFHCYFLKKFETEKSKFHEIVAGKYFPGSYRQDAVGKFSKITKFAHSFTASNVPGRQRIPQIKLQKDALAKAQ